MSSDSMPPGEVVQQPVGELSGAALDLAVYLADGWTREPVTPADFFACRSTWKLSKDGRAWCWECSPASPTEWWDDGGPLIESFGVSLQFVPASDRDPSFWGASIPSGTDADPEGGQMQRYAIAHGPTALVAAMRCFVASKA